MSDASTAVGGVGHAPGLQQRIKRIGLVAGPLLALLVYFALPVEYRAADGTTAPLTHAGRATLAMMAWMATWWMTEAVEIEVTSLLPIALFPILGVMPLGKTTANYGSDVIYLFLGGFVIALAIARCGLDRRIAFFTLRHGRNATEGDCRRHDGCDRLSQHVGVQYGDGRDDDSDRAVGDRCDVAPTDRQGPG